MNPIEISLTDTNGKTKSFLLTHAKQGVHSVDVKSDQGFGETHTDFAEINGLRIPGDMWRFFEGSLGTEELYKQLNSDAFEEIDGLSLFVSKFASTLDDDEALKIWEAIVAQASTQSETNRFWDDVVPYFGLDTGFDYNAHPEKIKQYLQDYDAATRESARPLG